MTVETLVSSLSQGMLWSLMAIGVYLTFRILDIADMTAEGSFPFGAAITVRALAGGTNPLIATLYGFLGGALAGLVSGLLHTKLKIPDLLTGILTMTGLYSVNLFVMKGAANMPISVKTVFNMVTFANSDLDVIVVGGLLLAVVIALLVLFFHTEMGLSARAVGDNQAMSAANGINADNMKIIVYMVSNGLIAMSGSLMAQMNGYADVSMGVGTLVIALSAIIIAELLLRHLTFGQRLLTIILGAFIYRLIIAWVLSMGVDPSYLRLFYSLMLVLFLALPLIKKETVGVRQRRANRKHIAEDK
ncbi:MULTISPECIES: ABC transporter permease [Lacticaseibacillus]|uniref:ABC transporter permease n=2 Tax=Lacticaseibacillus TaxID=2759736 RepID=A0ABW4CI33_9LACO|nr:MULTISPECIES: ABC transporter permease [Lacticaseibacillus]